MLGALAAVLGLCGGVQSVIAQEPDSDVRMEEEQRVTAIDVLVELGAEAEGRDGGSRSLPKGLTPGDFTVRLDGEPQQVVSYIDPRSDRSRGREGVEEPWSIVLYFDLELAQRDTVRWAAAELAELVPELVELGTVELVLAGDASLGGLAPTRDTELLLGELAALALRPRGVNRVIESRAEVLDALLEDPDAFRNDGEVGRALVEQEIALVENRLDDLLLALTPRGSASAKRAVFWINDGFDLEPGEFYRGEGIAVEDLPRLLRHRTAKFAVTLASYGWVAFGLSPPAPDAGLVPGLRIGKWLLGAPGEGPFFLRLTREDRRDPDEAEGHYQVGRAHLAAGEAQEAEEAFERALYHYAGDPRTAPQQAAAKVGLGRALEDQERNVEARQAFRHAIELDPKLAAELPQSRPRLLDGLAFSALLAADTAGRLVRDTDDLDEAVSSMSRRARLTYQVAGLPLGAVRKLEVTLTGSDRELRYPGWVRSGTPSGVTAARARRTARGEIEEGGLAVKAELSTAADGANAVVVEFEPTVEGEIASTDIAVFRVSVATGAATGVQTVRYRRFELAPAAGGENRRVVFPLEPPLSDESVAVVVEDLAGGLWGADLVN